MILTIVIMTFYHKEGICTFGLKEYVRCKFNTEVRFVGSEKTGWNTLMICPTCALPVKFEESLRTRPDN